MNTQKIKVEEFVYEKVHKADIEISIPQEPIFFQEYNRRVLIGIFPQRATWGNNEIWELRIIEVTKEKIQNTFIRTNSDELSKIISNFGIKNKSLEDYLQDKVVRYLKDYYGQDSVSKETFINGYQEQLNRLQEIIQ